MLAHSKLTFHFLVRGILIFPEGIEMEHWTEIVKDDTVFLLTFGRKYSRMD